MNTFIEIFNSMTTFMVLIGIGFIIMATHWNQNTPSKRSKSPKKKKK